MEFEDVVTNADDFDETSVVADLTLRGMTSRLVEHEGDVLMVLSDGEISVVLASGLGDTSSQAIVAAEQLATVAHQYAVRMLARTGQIRTESPGAPPPTPKAADSDDLSQ